MILCKLGLLSVVQIKCVIRLQTFHVYGASTLFCCGKAPCVSRVFQ